MRQEEVAFPRLAFAVAVAVVIGLVLGSTGAVWLMLRAEGVQMRTDPRVERVPREWLGILQTPIGADDTAAVERQRALEQLSAFSWVDRERGVVRIPITEAMAIVVQEGS